MKEMSVTIQEVYSTPNRIKKNCPCHIIVKLLNVQNKERILAAAREKDQLKHKCRLIRMIDDLSAKTMKARVTWKKQNKAKQSNSRLKWHHYPSGLHRQLQNGLSKHWNTYILLSSGCKFLPNWPHLSKQIKPQQILENWNHILYSMRPWISNMDFNSNRKHRKYTNSWRLNNTIER